MTACDNANSAHVTSHNKGCSDAGADDDTTAEAADASEGEIVRVRVVSLAGFDQANAPREVRDRVGSWHEMQAAQARAKTNRNLKRQRRLFGWLVFHVLFGRIYVFVRLNVRVSGCMTSWLYACMKCMSAWALQLSIHDHCLAH